MEEYMRDEDILLGGYFDIESEREKNQWAEYGKIAEKARAQMKEDIKHNVLIEKDIKDISGLFECNPVSDQVKKLDLHAPSSEKVSVFGKIPDVTREQAQAAENKAREEIEYFDKLTALRQNISDKIYMLETFRKILISSESAKVRLAFVEQNMSFDDIEKIVNEYRSIWSEYKTEESDKIRQQMTREDNNEAI